MLVDSAEITVCGGRGGAGMPKKPKGPDGGNGGNGGDVYIKCSANLNLLREFSEKDYFIAGQGGMGARKNKTGKQGDDIEILLPIGTSIYNKASGELIFETKVVGERYLICRGGRGGRGGLASTPGATGEKIKLKLSLRLIAFSGLIGLPNAGKSSLLNELTNAQAKAANYPFTTLEPNLGVFEGKCIADIPGLIEGSSGGKGLGIAFLKHIEKVEILLHCISSESQNIIKDYKTVRKELTGFNPELANKIEVVILTKTDICNKSYLSNLINKLKKVSKTVVAVSIYDYQSLENIKKLLRSFLLQFKTVRH